MGHFNKFYFRSFILILLFFGMIHSNSITSHAVQYISHPISFSGSEYIELTDGSDDPVIQNEYNQMMRSTGSSNISMGSRAYYALMSYNTPAFTLATGLNPDDVYEVQLSFNYSLTPSPTQTDSSLRFRNCHAAFASLLLNSYSNNTLPYSFSGTKTYYLSGSTIMASNTCLIRTFVTASNALSFTMNIDFNIQVDSIELVSGDSDAAYQQGYNAGYSAGEDAGYSSGYSAGYSAGEGSGYSSGYNAGYSAGEDAGYNTGYDDGISSVDTQSFYDAGYNAGYSIGYSAGEDAGYSSGYTAGYDFAMNRIGSWGADTADYPILVNSYSGYSFSDTFTVNDDSVYKDYSYSTNGFMLNNSFDPNHIYKFEIVFKDFNYSYSDGVYFDSFDSYFRVGGYQYPLFVNKNVANNIFIPGNVISNSFFNEFVVYNARTYSNILGTFTFSGVYDWYLYDYGPTGDTQNHIANQTDQLTNGFSDDSGNSMNNSLSNGLDDFHDQEHSLFTSVQTGLDDFEYFDFNSAPAMLTGISFVSSIMTGWFNAAGGVSGVGIVLSILFSIIIASMALGLYKWYQSRGK